MDEDEPTEAELDALTASRKRVIDSFRVSALNFEVPAVRVGNGLSQRGNFIEANRTNPNLNDNPNAATGIPSGFDARTITVFDANGDVATMDVIGTEPEAL